MAGLQNAEDMSVPSSEMIDLNAPSQGQMTDFQGDALDQDTLSDEIAGTVGGASPSASIYDFLGIQEDGSEVSEIPNESPSLQREKQSGELEEEEEEEQFLDEKADIKEDVVEEELRVVEGEEEGAVEHKAEEYTYIDVFELNATGEEILVKKLVPKIKEEVFIKKKMVPITVKFNRIGDGDEVIEEEETVEEEMSFRITRTTILIKELNEKGEEVLVEKVIEKEVLIEEKPKKFKKVYVTKTLPNGEEVEEEIEVPEEEEIAIRKSSEISRKTVPEEHQEFLEEEGMWEYQDYIHEFIDEQGEAHYTTGVRRVWMQKHKEIPMNLLIAEEKQFKMELLEELRTVRKKLKLCRQKNKFLGKKLCQYYKLKRKNLRDERQRLSPETEELLRRQYHRRLLEYNEIRQFLLSERELRNSILDNADSVTTQLKTELDSRIESFFERQREIIKKIDPKVSKIVLRNVDFEQIVNQQFKMDQLLSKVRHNYVRKMNQFTELKQKHALRKRTKPSNREDDVDIVTYEQLKVATRNLQDKLDIKESYILSLKEKLVHAVQTLAHVRFKNEAIDQNLDQIKKEIVESKRELVELRNECVKIREKRSKVMEKVKQEWEKFGIMKFPIIIRDYFELMDEKAFLTEEIVKVKNMLDNQKVFLDKYKEKYYKNKKGKQK
ncbi:trichohyalin-like [Cimex lectularius]|uniref:CCDC113/CCDC96 coiled-coil domain-containing protein n=1 Tax=Cimex lectularius TaxID=79782 RepID=A0A8I6RDL1_CIMLE|nr:trichohyalin-like [Cimex lectularius]XP_014243325.1 trichohyalin-like [Cimex lectularius]